MSLPPLGRCKRASWWCLQASSIPGAVQHTIHLTPCPVYAPGLVSWQVSTDEVMAVLRGLHEDETIMLDGEEFFLAH